jgi:hypothetical protein
MRCAGHVAHMGDMRNAYKILVGKPQGKRPHGRPMCRWEDSIRMDLKEVKWKVSIEYIRLRIGTSGRLM